MATQNERAVIDLVINGEQAKTSLKAIKAEAIDARKQFNRMIESDDPQAYKKKIEEIKLLDGAVASMSGNLKQSVSGWQTFKKEAGTIMAGVAGGNIATWGLETLVGLIPMAIDKTINLRDSLADIAKTTGMTDNEVQDLNQSLKNLDTRTPTKDLREMAVVAGQFGIPKEQIEGFVAAADKLNVALGDQFDGAEAVATVMTGLRNVFSDIKTQDVGDDMLHIGNAINVLESAGAATAPVIADFASRIGGVAIPLGLTTPEVLGLSAALQEMQISQERGSTAMVDILNGMAKAPAAFAKYAVDTKGASLSTKEFAQLLNTDMMGALMAVVRGFKEGDTSATGMAKKLDDMDLKGNGVMEVFMKMATNTELVTKRVEEAGGAIGNTSSTMAEFNKKNYDLALNLKKLSEWFSGLLSKTGLPGFAEWLVNATTRLLGLTTAADESNRAFERQRDSVRALEKETVPLLKRYDELKAKTKLSTTEQTELDKIIKQIAGTIPQAVTQFDKMGNAMAISTEKARQYIIQQKEVLKYTNRQAIADTDSELERARRQQLDLLAERKRGTVSEGGTSANERYRERPMTTAELQQVDNDIKAKNAQLAALEARRSGLSGDYLSTPVSPATPAKKGKGADTADYNFKETANEKSERLQQEKRDRAYKREVKAAAKKEESFDKLLEDSLVRMSKGRDKTFEREQIQFGEHYAKMLALAGNNKKKQEEVVTLMYDELSDIEARELKRKEEQAKKVDDKKTEEEKKSNKRSYDVVIGALEEQNADSTGKIGLNPDGSLDKTKGEAEIKMLELQQEENFLTAKLLLQQAYSQASADTETALTENHTKQMQFRAATTAAYNEQLKQAEFALQDARRTAMSEGVGILKGFVGQHTIAYKAMVVAQKAFAIADIIINNRREVAQVWANPTWTLLPDAGVSLKGAYTAAANMRMALGIAGVVSQGIQELAAPGTALAKKDDGGFTGIRDLYGDPQGFYDQPTRVNAGRRSYIMGEKRREFIMGGAMIEDPVFANLAMALDAVQQRGDYSRFSQLGSGAAPATAPVATSGSGSAMDTRLMLENNRLLQQVVIGREQPVVFNYRLYEDYKAQVDQVRMETSL